jgi:hypothetical protein
MKKMMSKNILHTFLHILISISTFFIIQFLVQIFFFWILGGYNGVSGKYYLIEFLGLIIFILFCIFMIKKYYYIKKIVYIYIVSIILVSVLIMTL